MLATFLFGVVITPAVAAFVFQNKETTIDQPTNKIRGFLFCHHDPAATIMLGAIQRSIHSSQQSRTRHAMRREDGDAEGESHCSEALSFELEMKLLGVFANEFGALACHLA